jgi:hypothetical protein
MLKRLLETTNERIDFIISYVSLQKGKASIEQWMHALQVWIRIKELIYMVRSTKNPGVLHDIKNLADPMLETILKTLTEQSKTLNAVGDKYQYEQVCKDIQQINDCMIEVMLCDLHGTKNIAVPITLYFGEDQHADIVTNGVPKSLIVEALNSISKGFCEQIISESEGDVQAHEMEDYLDALMQTDRLKLEQMLK